MLKELTSLTLVAAQVSLLLAMTPAFAAGPTPEFNLFQGAIALEGQNLPTGEFQSRVAGLYKQYATATATSPGTDQRLSDALVQLKLYTPAQANTLVTQFDAAAQRLSSQQYTSEDPANRAMTLEVTSILQNNPQGAQFSGCGALTVADIVLGLGGAFALVSAGYDYLQYYNEGDHFSGAGLDTKAGNLELAVGGAAGIAAAVGLFYLVSSTHECS